MSTHSDLNINLDKLERELVSAVQADKKYSRENDAKFRAIGQKVATYEEFRDIVKASHLSPLERKDIVDSWGKQPWNSVAHTGSSRSTDSDGMSLPSSDSGLPSNVQSFMREWRKKRYTPAEQYQFLIEIGGEKLLDIFRVEISMGLLGDILTALNKGWRDEDAYIVNSILSHLPETSRFSLSISFLTEKEKLEASELLRKLSRTDLAVGASSIDELAVLYSVQLDP